MSIFCLKTNNFKRDSQSRVDYYMKEYQRFLTFKTATPGVSKDAAARKMVKSVGLRRAVCLKFNPSNHIDQICASKNLLARRDWPMYMAAYALFLATKDYAPDTDVDWDVREANRP